jgi:hypothetical protein
VQQELDNDANQDAEARVNYGEQWRLSPAATLAKPYWDKISVIRWDSKGTNHFIL